MPHNNRIVVDLNKAQYAWRSWVTLCGNYKRATKPTRPTVHGQEFDENAISYVPGGLIKEAAGAKVETMLERATRMHMLDTWIPCVTFQITANHRLTYTGNKAEALWKAWNEKIFSKKKRVMGT